MDLLDSLVRHAVSAVLDRRSVHLLLEELWHVNRDEFWQRILVLTRDTTPGLSRAVAAQSVVKLAGTAADLSPLLDALAVRSTTHDAKPAIRFLCGYVASDPAAVDPAVWLSWALSGVTCTDEGVRGALAGMVYQILRHRRHDLQAGAKGDAAVFARTLLATALERNSPLYSLRMLIDTMSFDVSRNLASLRALLSPTCQHPSREDALDDLSREVDALQDDPELVGGLYKRAIRLEADEEARERSESLRWYDEARAADLEGREIPRVPFHGRHHRDIETELREHARKFIERTPLLAARVIVDGLRYRDAVVELPVSGQIALTVGATHFVVPDRPPGRVRHSLELSEYLRAMLVHSLGNADEATQKQLLDLFVSVPAPESLWSAIIEAAAHLPRLRGIALALLRTPEALRLFSHAAAAFIRGCGHGLPPEAREQIVSAMAQLVAEDDRHARSRIEAALTSNETSRGPTHSRDSDEFDSDDLDPDELNADVVEVAGSADGDDVFDMSRFKLTSEELQTPANMRLRNARRATHREEQKLEMALQKRSSSTESVETDAALASISELRAALNEEEAHPAMVVTGWCLLSRTASLIGKIGDDRATSLIYESSARNESMPWNGDGSFTDLLNAGQVVVRAEAVRGLIALAARADIHAFSEIERLARDVEPAVRFQVAWCLRDLSDLEPAKVWPLLERLVDDPSTGVVAAAVRQLRAFFAKNRDRAIRLADAALIRLTGNHETEHGARTDLLLQLSWYHLARGEEISTRAMERVLVELPRTTVGLAKLLHSYRDWLTMGADDEESETAARKRTVVLFKRIAAGCVAGIRAEADRNPNARQRTERGEHAQLLEQLVYQLYFASGAFRSKGGDEDLSAEVVGRFYADVKDLLLQIGLAGSNAAADKTLDILEYLLRVSRDTDLIPSREVLDAFVTIAEAMIRDGAADNVWLLDPVENVLRRCVAERDPSLYDESMLGSWGRILDPLLEKGWQQAYRLARDLDVSR